LGPDWRYVDSGQDVVAAGHVGREFVDQVALAPVHPQVVVAVDDREIGFDDRLGCGEWFSHECTLDATKLKVNH
jgi:phage/plasmid primase-like uncharacterized protein